ncbi:hypothetical protein NMY22_g1860 [Coprinellus aureogranulatus]|nr:hypothetical protein NMY22_g1860 [Coprinellus aureogranulatus]
MEMDAADPRKSGSLVDRDGLSPARPNLSQIQDGLEKANSAQLCYLPPCRHLTGSRFPGEIVILATICCGVCLAVALVLETLREVLPIVAWFHFQEGCRAGTGPVLAARRAVGSITPTLDGCVAPWLTSASHLNVRLVEQARQVRPDKQSLLAHPLDALAMRVAVVHPLKPRHPDTASRSQTNFDLVLFPEVEEPKELHIHTLLGHVGPYTDPEIPYDLSIPISQVKEQFGINALLEPATQPPVQNLTITCPDLPLWDIEIKTSTIHPGAYVSVDDVVTKIYSYLREPVNSMEYERLGQNQAAVNVSYFARLARIHDPAFREQEAKKGIKRVDFLRGRHRFMGLSVLHRPGDQPCWELSVS